MYCPISCVPFYTVVKAIILMSSLVTAAQWKFFACSRAPMAYDTLHVSIYMSRKEAASLINDEKRILSH